VGGLRVGNGRLGMQPPKPLPRRSPKGGNLSAFSELWAACCGPQTLGHGPFLPPPPGEVAAKPPEGGWFGAVRGTWCVVRGG